MRLIRSCPDLRAVIEFKIKLWAVVIGVLSGSDRLRWDLNAVRVRSGDRCDGTPVDRNVLAGALITAADASCSFATDGDDRAAIDGYIRGIRIKAAADPGAVFTAHRRDMTAIDDDRPGGIVGTAAYTGTVPGTLFTGDQCTVASRLTIDGQGLEAGHRDPLGNG